MLVQIAACRFQSMMLSSIYVEALSAVEGDCCGIAYDHLKLNQLNKRFSMSHYGINELCPNLSTSPVRTYKHSPKLPLVSAFAAVLPRETDHAHNIVAPVGTEDSGLLDAPLKFLD